MRSSVIQNNFTAGELTPLLHARPELEPYMKGLATCRNMTVLRHGGATRRDGTKYLGEAKNADKKVRLIPFVFSQDDSMIIEMGDQYMRFWDEGGPLSGSTDVVNNGDFDTSITGWTDASIPASGVASLSWDGATQSMLMYTNTAAGQTIARQTLTVVTATSYLIRFRALDLHNLGTFGIRVGSTLGGTEYAHYTFATNGAKAFYILTTGTTVYLEFYHSGTVPAVPSYAKVDEVSCKSLSVIELATPYTEAELYEVMYAQSNDVMWLTHRNHEPRVLTRTDTSPLTMNISTATYLEGPFATLAEKATTMTITGTYTRGGAGTLTCSAAFFNAADTGSSVVLLDPTDLTVYAVVQVSGYISTTQVNITMLTAVPAGLQATATTFWAMQAISWRYGYPSAVTLHDQRLIYGGTEAQKQSVFGSTVGNFEAFSFGTNDDDHYNYELASTRQNDITFLGVRHDLIIGTVSNEWKANGGGLEQPITPSNIVMRQGTSAGARRVQPEECDDILCFVQRSGHKLMGLSYSQEGGRVQTTDMGLLAEHMLISSVIQQISYKQERESIIWVVDDAGQLLGVTYDGEQNTLAWHKHDSGAQGAFTGVATIPSAGNDRTYVAVQRVVDGNDVTYIELLEDKDWRIDDDPYYVDCGITYSGAATTTITGLDHLEGETVEAYGDGENLGEYVVASGQITLTKAASRVHVGLGYISEIEELPEKQNGQDGSSHTRRKRKPKVDLRLYRTQGIRVNGDIRNLPRDASVSKPELFSGIIETTDLGWDYDAANNVQSVGPNPLTILAIRSTYEVGNE